MNHTIGVLRTENSSSKFLSSTKVTWQELALLVLLGAAAVTLHVTFRFPLRLPGHHGLEWMALLLFGRLTGRYRWAATVSSLGAAGIALLPIWGLGDPFVWLIYALPGPVIDLAYLLGVRWQHNLIFLGILGGAAYATKPLARLAIGAAMGWPYGSLLYGVVYPVATHILFGVAGAVAGVLLARTLLQRTRGSV